MTEFNYCYRDITYQDNDFVCIANVIYTDIFTGEQIAYKQFDADDPQQCDIDMRAFECVNNLIIDGCEYEEDVEAILYDMKTDFPNMKISIYVKDVIDVYISLTVYAITDLMLIIDILDFNTPDSVLISVSYDNNKPTFEFYV